jgi:hypothetical protein
MSDLLKPHSTSGGMLGGIETFINPHPTPFFAAAESYFGGNDSLGVFETIFADVMSRLIVITILLILAYYAAVYVYDNYIGPALTNVRNMFSKLISMVEKITSFLTGGAMGAVSGAANAAGSVVNKIPGGSQATDFLKGIF